MNLPKLLRQPYPIADSAGGEWAIGAFVGGFLLLFQPFGLDDWQTSDKALKILGFGAITTAVMFLVNESTRLLPRYFAEENWTVGREIGKVLLLISLIALANRLYLSWLLNQPLQGGWLFAIGMTFLIGIFPTVGVILTNYIYQLRRYQQGATRLLPHPPANVPNEPEPPLPGTSVSGSGTFVSEKIVDNQLLTLVAENGKDTLQLTRRELLAIESSDNYCTVFYLKNGSLAKELMRTSLSRLENQLGQPSLVRCHRSYLVNLAQVGRVSGNAQGYKLHLLHGDLTVPVARQYNDTLVSGLR